jgi:hypothetical protein
MRDLTEALLGLVSATSWDGGQGLVHALREALAAGTPFDAGEVAFAQPVEFRRWSFTDSESDIAAADLLMHVGVCGKPLLVDDLPELEEFPATLENMRAHGLQSLLLFPLAPAGGPVGAIVLARRFGWAFAGAPISYLWPLARMGGLCLERALALTALRRKLDFMGDGERDQRGSVEVLRRERDDAVREAETLRRELAVARTAAPEPPQPPQQPSGPRGRRRNARA